MPLMQSTSQSTPIECLIGNLIGGQEALLRALGVADSRPHTARSHPSTVVRRITDRRHLDSLIATAHVDVALLISECSAASPYLESLLDQTRGLLARGVACRVALNPGVRQEAAYAEWARQVQCLGGELRWITEEFKPMILIDGNSALIPDASRSALLVTESTLVAVLARVFGNIWNGAEHSAGEDLESRDAIKVNVSTRESIIKMLVSGSPDKIIAKNLGISLRSVQAHVATVRMELGANTRAQLGYLLGRASRC